ncbi:MAG: FRG domain-containing protein, partial [Spirochaetes bacterium]|nr:FRG domain-containing protein [Spirochaetota bacterium]
RGHSDADWHLLPSVKRLYTDEKERALVHDFYIKSKTLQKNTPKRKDYAGWLTIMQHYGLPTRLLDWSKSPLIAAYFATEKKTSVNNDACIWALCPSELNASFEYGRYLYPMDKPSVKKLLYPAFNNKNDTEDNNALQINNSVIACLAVEHNMRVYVQQSAFTVHNSNIPLDQLDNNENWLVKYIIPRENKKQFSISLMLLGFEIDNIYPDLDHISKSLL